MKQIHVSCKSGNDSWSGMLAMPNTDGSDGPLRTLTAAQSALRKIKRQQSKPAPIEILLQGGYYALEQTWYMDQADSGSGTRGHFTSTDLPVTWRAADGEDVTIGGGRRIEDWQAASLNGHAVWRAQVPWMDSPKRFFRQLWVDGKRRPRAMLPKIGTFRVATSPDKTLEWSKSLWTGVERFGYRPGDLNSKWTNIEAIDVQFRVLWLAPRVRMLRIDEAESIVQLDRNTQIGLEHAPDDGVDYVVENVLEALSEPGEWYLDPVARCVWYRPLPGERPGEIEAITGDLDCLLEMRNVKYVTFENIRFAHAEWSPDSTEAVGGGTGAQAAALVPAAVAVGQGCEVVTFQTCEIAHVGGYGLECTDGATAITFRNGTIHDLGAGGAKIWHGCRRCVIENSAIFDGGHLFMSGTGVLIGKASGNTVTHCHIHDFYYTGISVGWTWGYAESDAYGNVIEWNHIHDLGKGKLSDLGGVYLLGNATGTRVRHNRIHDIRSLRYGGWAMYPDEGSSNLLIENNLCYNTDREIFHQHYGRNNLIRNNIFAYGGEAVVAYTHMEEHLGLIFENNILVARDTPMVKRVDDVRWRSDRTRFTNNLYWYEGGKVDEIRFEGGWRNLASQSLPGKFIDEAQRALPLPETGTIIRELHVQGRSQETTKQAGEFLFVHDGKSLQLRARFAGSPGQGVPEQPPWGDWRAHIELFLKPFTFCPALVRLIVTADGADAVTWYGCEGPEKIDWKRAATLDKGDSWEASLEVSFEAILRPIRAACAIPEACPAQWHALAGVALPVASLDFPAWQQHTGDHSGLIADPGFIDPDHGDFRLRPDSPALALGFAPFACPE